MGFYYENYDFQGEKQVFCKSCKTALGAKMTTSILITTYFYDQKSTTGMHYWNGFLECSEGFFKWLKIFFLKKCQNFVLYFYFMSKIVLE